MVRSSNVSGEARAEATAADADFNTFTPHRRASSLLFTLLISFATFNIRGLGSQQDDSRHSKREMLGKDCENYRVDICALQETKVTQSEALVLANGYNLFLFDQHDGRHGGLGFVISPRLMNYVVC